MICSNAVVTRAARSQLPDGRITGRCGGGEGAIGLPKRSITPERKLAILCERLALFMPSLLSALAGQAGSDHTC